MKIISDGIIRLEVYGRFKNAVWILHNNGEAAIVEMPPYSKGRDHAPYMDTAAFLSNNGLFPKYGFLTHPHWDHCQTLPYFRKKFPHTHFVAHRSFIEDPYFKFIQKNVRLNSERDRLHDEYRFFDDVFDDDLWRGYIGGEPVYMIHAPKHSYADHLIIFKGAMITGDWYIGDLKDCNNLVHPSVKIRSIDRVVETVRNLDYNIHMLFSGHGDHLFYDADFYSIMEQSKIDHGESQPALKANFIAG